MKITPDRQYTLELSQAEVDSLQTFLVTVFVSVNPPVLRGAVAVDVDHFRTCIGNAHCARAGWTSE